MKDIHLIRRLMNDLGLNPEYLINYSGGRFKIMIGYGGKFTDLINHGYMTYPTRQIMLPTDILSRVCVKHFLWLAEVIDVNFENKILEYTFVYTSDREGTNSISRTVKSTDIWKR